MSTDLNQELSGWNKRVMVVLDKTNLTATSINVFENSLSQLTTHHVAAQPELFSFWAKKQLFTGYSLKHTYHQDL